MASPTATRRALPVAIALLLAAGVFVPPFSNAEWPLYARAIPLVLAVAIALRLFAGGSRGKRQVRLPAASARIVASLVFAGGGVLLLVAATTGGRGLGFHLLSGLLGSALLVHIWLGRELRPGLTLACVVVLTAVVRIAALAITPGYIGLDIWSHVPSFATAIMAEGSVEAIAGDKYAVSPLYHLAVISTALLANVPLRAALVFSVGFGMLVAPLLVYAIASPILGSRWALFAAAVYALADHAILWGIYLVPTSLGLLFFLGLCVALFDVIRRGYTVGNTALFFLLLLAVVFTHQVSSFIAAVLVGSAVLAQLILTVPRLGPDRPTNLLWVFLGCVGLVVGLWTVTPYSGAGGSFVDTVLVFLREAHQTTTGIAIEYGVPEADYGMRPFESAFQLVEAAGFLLLVVVAGIGAIGVANRARIDQPTLTLVIGAGTMGGFLLVPALVGIRTFLPGRWFAFLFVPLSILGALGASRLDSLFPRLLLACVLVFALVFPLTMAVSAPATIENPVVEDRPQYAFSEADLTGMETIGEHTTGTLHTDYLYAEAFDRIGAQSAQSAALSGDAVEGDPYVHREYQATESPLYGPDHNDLTIQRVDRETACSGHLSYDNGQVTLCE